MGNKSSKSQNIHQNLDNNQQKQRKQKEMLEKIIEKQIKIKIVFIGDTKVGKSSISQRLASNQFPSEYNSTVGADFHLLKHKINNITYLIQIWDTAGEQRYYSLLSLYLKDNNFTIIVLQTTNKQIFFKGLKKWTPMLQEYGGTKIVLGTKIDLNKKKKISYNQGKKYVQAKGYKYFQVSAKDNINTKEFVDFLIQQTQKNKKQVD